jgi:DNA repair photolyase
MQKKRTQNRPLLNRIVRPCHGELLNLHLFEDCPAGCLHCRYGRGETPGAKPRSSDPPKQLIGELERRRMRTKLPAFIVMGASFEPFATSGEVRDLSHRCLEVLFGRKVAVSIETRGEIPKKTIELLRANRRLVRARVAIPSIDPKMLKRWEPGTAGPEQRLFNLQRLKHAGVPSVLHLAPIIPFVNDSAEHLTELLDAAADLRVRRVTAELLRVYPGARQVLQSHLGGTAALILGAYMDRTTLPARPRQTLPTARRQTFYENLREWTRTRRLHLSICRCADHELGTPPCSLGFGTTRRPVRQMGLFAAPTDGARRRKSQPSIDPDTASRPRRGQISFWER